MEYIRKTYGVPAKRRGRISFSSLPPPLIGTIVGSRGAHLRVRFDGRPGVHSLHPTWQVKYLESSDA